jgi:hypothetical protein
VLRVAGYAALMTDKYPPFRLDLGGDDPSTVALRAGPAIPSGAGAYPAGGPAGSATTQTMAERAGTWPATPAPPAGSLQPGSPPPGSPPPGSPPPGSPPPAWQAPGAPPAGLGPGSRGWSAGSVIALVVGCLVTFAAVGLLTGGIALAVGGQVARDGDGYLSTSTESLSTTGYALTSDSFRLEGNGPAWALPSNLLGTVRVRVAASDSDRAVFVGVAPTAQADQYLSGVRYDTVRRLGVDRPTYDTHPGQAPTTPPGSAGIWAASTSGTGEQTLTWKPSGGDWTVVVMNADGSGGVTVSAAIGATVPALGWIAAGLIVAGAVTLAVGILIVVLVIREVGRRQREPGFAGPPAARYPG